jgi:hypothetical protein
MMQQGETMDDHQQVEWGPCCLCGNGIEPKAPDPLTITAETSEAKWQVWFAHSACFRKMLVDPPEAPGLFDAAHF